MNLPNRLTLARIIMVPIFVALISINHVACYVAAYVVFALATITDYYDGKIARERNQITNFGKLLDPVADKVLLASGFVLLMRLPDLCMPGWTVVVIIAREFLVTGARSLAASDGVVIGASAWGKTKAILQMTYIFVFLFLVIVLQGLRLWAPPETAASHAQGISLFVKVAPHYLQTASFWAIILVALYTVYTGAQFVYTNWQALRLGNSQ